jgi:crotonobetaine/carnitine-CoA ligase
VVHSAFQLAALTPVVAAGACLILAERYSASRFWEQARAEGATVLQIISMIVRTLLMRPADWMDRDHTVRQAWTFMPLTEPEKDAFEDRFGVDLRQAYGSTESICWVATDPPAGPKCWASVGRPGLGYDIVAMGPDGAELPPGETGELCVRGVRGRTVMAGYFADPDATAKVFTEDGWLRTGDVGYLDAAGWVYFVDRAANLIKRSGENISATEVEAVLAGHPQIAEAVVMGVPDPVRDEIVAAFVLPVPGMAVTADGVAAHCRTQLTACKVPTVIEILPELPRTTSLKPDRRALRADYLARTDTKTSTTT